MVVLDAYTYNPQRKKVNTKITKRVKAIDNFEEMVIEEVVLIRNTTRSNFYCVSRNGLVSSNERKCY